jgi:hypothetical protein
MMKQAIIFKGGLGNQMLQYGMYTYCRDVLRNDVCYFYREGDHNGFELDKYFDVHLQKAPCWMVIFYWLAWRLYKYGICKRFLAKDGDTARIEKALYINGYWSNKKYFSHPGFDLQFKQLSLNNSNHDVVQKMKDQSSIAVHVRRGDYLKPENARIFTTLTADYYNKALEKCRQQLGSEATVFFFSDDIAWVRQNIKASNAVYVDWNRGDDSIYDMYLMSLASANIIANSSFSFWAARLNKRSQLVVYPDNWYANGAPKKDIFPDSWVAI